MFHVYLISFFFWSFRITVYDFTRKLVKII